jgi:16S rRNA (uracil1498-N3)-methyltransferase
MRLSRFFIEQTIGGSEVLLSDEEIIYQLARVLKIKVGEQIILFNGSGKDFVCEILEIGKKQIRLRIVETRENKSEPRRAVILFQSLIKKDNFETAIAKSVEVGAAKFVPILASRSEKKDFSRERLSKIVKESVEQSGRAAIPEIENALAFSVAIREATGKVFLLDASGEHVSKLFNEIKNSDEVSLFVGPEGGWTGKEVALARERGAKIVSIGSRILRSETAGPVSIGILLSLLD